jgi:hypothetical protein
MGSKNQLLGSEKPFGNLNFSGVKVAEEVVEKIPVVELEKEVVEEKVIEEVPVIENEEVIEEVVEEVKQVKVDDFIPCWRYHSTCPQGRIVTSKEELDYLESIGWRLMIPR